MEQGRGMDLDPMVLDAMLSKLSSDPTSPDIVNTPPPCMPIFLDQAVRSKLLKKCPHWTISILQHDRWVMRPEARRSPKQMPPAARGVLTPAPTPARGRSSSRRLGPLPKWAPGHLLFEAMDTTHFALCHVRHVLQQERDGLDEE
jgi:hypothetical protein